VNSPKIVIVGAGHMASYLLSGLARTGIPLDNICITDKDPQKLAELVKRFAVQTSLDNDAVIRQADVVLLAIKPQSLGDFAQQHHSAFAHKPIVISILAGMPIAQITALLGPMPIIRAMPNILVSLSQGNTILYADKQYELVEQFFAPLGIVQWVDEEQQLDAYTVLTGCGPGYLFYMMQCVIDAAVELGIPEKNAKNEVLQLFSGTAQMATESPYSLIELQQQVASKKGVTEKLLDTLKAQHMDTIFKQAFSKAYARGQQLKDHKE
jgi:pyrroline-5-carboxylate reductase